MVLDGYERPNERGELKEQLDRMEGKLDQVIEDTAYLKTHLGEHHTVILNKLNEDDSTREAFFATIQKGIDGISRKLPANDPILPEAKKFKTEPEIKTKVKLALHLLFLTLETEINWDMKAMFQKIAQDMKNGHIFLKPD